MEEERRPLGGCGGRAVKAILGDFVNKGILTELFSCCLAEDHLLGTFCRLRSGLGGRTSGRETEISSNGLVCDPGPWKDCGEFGAGYS